MPTVCVLGRNIKKIYQFLSEILVMKFSMYWNRHVFFFVFFCFFFFFCNVFAPFHSATCMKKILPCSCSRVGDCCYQCMAL